MKAEIIENDTTKFKSLYLPLSLFDKFTMRNSSVGSTDQIVAKLLTLKMSVLSLLSLVYLS